MANPRRLPVGPTIRPARNRTDDARSSMPTLRVIHDVPAAGDWNMAVDETLVESVADAGTPTLRLYGWSPATLSLGYFQSLADRAQHSASAACPVARRPSGGGAILHDRELTYCLVLPADFPVARQVQQLYRIVHESLRAVLAEQKITVELRENTISISPEPFLCFQRQAEGDLLFQGVKVCGSAQRRHAGAVVQHGSLLLAASPYAPELPGLQELSGQAVSALEVANLLERDLSRRLGFDSVDHQLTEAEHARAERTRQSKYASMGWTAKR
jgi:lipoate-protein ligase A